MKNLIPFLLFAVACNPLTRIQKSQAAIKSIVTAANSERVIQKDSFVYLKGRVDSFTTTIRDSLTHTVQTNNFYHSSDTIKIITNDPLQERALLERASIAEGKLSIVSDNIQRSETHSVYFIVTIAVLCIAIGGLIFFRLKI